MLDKFKRWVLGPPLAALIGIKSFRVVGIDSRKTFVFFSLDLANGAKRVINVPLSEIEDFLEGRERRGVAEVNARKILPVVLAIPFVVLAVVYLILKFVIWR